MADREQLAREALAEFTRPGDVGPYLDTVDEGQGAVTLHFAANMPGYPGWRWTVSLAELEGDEPTVLETELLPGPGALLAPDWVPWSERLEEWRAQQAAEAAERGESAEGADDDADADDDSADDDESDGNDESDDDDLDDESDDDDADDDESDDDDTDDDDDLGDDVYDGLDPEAAVGLDEPDDREERS